jgi:hypothetical protein
MKSIKKISRPKVFIWHVDGLGEEGRAFQAALDTLFDIVSIC